MEKEKIYSYISNNKLDMECLIKNYTNYINTIIRNSRIHLSDEDIEEITLDVFLTVWKNQDRLDINKNMSPYIAGITNNLLKKKARDSKINIDIDEYEDKISDWIEIDDFVLENEKRKMLVNELEKIKSEDKEIFIQYYYEEKSIRELSIIFKMSESKIKSKLFRARKKMKKLLKERGYDLYE